MSNFKVLNALRQITINDLVRGTVRLVCRYPTLVFAVILILTWGRYVPDVSTLPAAAQSIHFMTYTVGLVWLIGQTVLRIIHTPDHKSQALTVIGCLEQFTLLILVLLLVRTYGAELSTLVMGVKANPDEAIGFVLALVFLRIAFLFASDASGVATRYVEAVGYTALLRPKRQRTAQDIYRTSVHEAGHLLAHAGDELPPNLSVKVVATLNEHDLYRGRVTHTGDAPDVVTSQLVYKSMLLYLAGTEAEYVILGDRADGAAEDNRKWLRAATHYLTSGFGDVFYEDPDGQAQIVHNRAVLCDLKAVCVEELQRFLSLNKALLEELASAIADQKTMNREQLLPYLARVVNPIVMKERIV